MSGELTMPTTARLVTGQLRRQA